jgi:hypothetical protein
MPFKSVKECVFHFAEVAAKEKQVLDSRVIASQVRETMKTNTSLETVQSYLSNWRGGKTVGVKRIKASRIHDFGNLPNATTYSAKTSTITKAFADAIAPSRYPTQEEYDEYIKIFPLNEGAKTCAYCGGAFRYYEHFRPIVKDKQPTGYGSDIYNLVPSCNDCNEKKRGEGWREFMETRKKVASDISAHDERVCRLERFEEWGNERVIKIDYEELIGKETWKKYQEDRDRIHTMLRECHELQKEIRKSVAEHVKKLTD